MSEDREVLIRAGEVLELYSRTLASPLGFLKTFKRPLYSRYPQGTIQKYPVPGTQPQRQRIVGNVHLAYVRQHAIGVASQAQLHRMCRSRQGTGDGMEAIQPGP